MPLCWHSCAFVLKVKQGSGGVGETILVATERWVSTLQVARKGEKREEEKEGRSDRWSERTVWGWRREKGGTRLSPWKQHGKRTRKKKKNKGSTFEIDWVGARQCVCAQHTVKIHRGLIVLSQLFFLLFPSNPFPSGSQATALTPRVIVPCPALCSVISAYSSPHGTETRASFFFFFSFLFCQL